MTDRQHLTTLEANLARALRGTPIPASADLAEAILGVLEARYRTPRAAFLDAVSLDRAAYVTSRGRALLKVLARAAEKPRDRRVGYKLLTAALRSAGWPTQNARTPLSGLLEAGLVTHYIASDTYAITDAGLERVREDTHG